VNADCHDQCPMRRRYNLMRWTMGVTSWTVKPERTYTRRKLRPQKQWDGTQGLLRVWRQHRNIEKKWIDFRENWRKLAWITHSTKSSAWCASAGEVHNNSKEESKRPDLPKRETGPFVASNRAVR
jgi:hypothetical protein